MCYEQSGCCDNYIVYVLPSGWVKDVHLIQTFHATYPSWNDLTYLISQGEDVPIVTNVLNGASRGNLQSSWYILQSLTVPQPEGTVSSNICV